MHGRKYAQAPGLRPIPRSRAFTVTPRSTTSGNGSIPSWVGSMPSTRWCMVGLPTRAASTMSSRSMPACAATAQASSRIAPCTAAVSAGRLALVLLKVGDAAHQILAEPDLRIHHAAARDHLAGLEVAQVSGDGGGAHVDRQPVHVFLESGPHRDELAAVAHRDGALPVAAPGLAGAHRRGQALEEAQVRAQTTEPPFAFECLQHPGEVAGLVRHARAVELDVEQLDHRVDFEVADLLGRLAHHLAVDLAVGRHVDDHVALHHRLAAQTPPVREALDPVVLLLGRGRAAEVGLARSDPELRELAGAERDLAAPADGAPAAHRVDVHPEAARRGEHRGAGREVAAPPRRHEDDAGRRGALRLGRFAHEAGSGMCPPAGFAGAVRSDGFSMTRSRLRAGAVGAHRSRRRRPRPPGRSRAGTSARHPSPAPATERTSRHGRCRERRWRASSRSPVPREARTRRMCETGLRRSPSA